MICLAMALQRDRRAAVGMKPDLRLWNSVLAIFTGLTLFLRVSNHQRAQTAELYVFSGRSGSSMAVAELKLKRAATEEKLTKSFIV